MNCTVWSEGSSLSLFHVRLDLTAGLDGDKDIQSPLFGRLSADRDKASSNRHILPPARHRGKKGSHFD